jgi:hypothetical protein
VSCGATQVLGADYANNQVRVMTVEKIQNAGGAILPTRRTPDNPYHVTVTNLSVEELNNVFGPAVKKNSL